MPEIGLGVTLWIPRLSSAFSPSVAVTVQRHAFDIQAVTSLLELRRAILLCDGDEVRKQRAALRPAAKDFGGLFAETRKSVLAVLFPAVKNCSIFLVDVLGVQIRNVSL